MMNADDTKEYIRLGAQLYFERRLREFIHDQKRYVPKEIYAEMMLDPEAFHKRYAQYFRMPLEMMITQFQAFKDIE